MNIAFAGFRHSHIFLLYKMALQDENVNITGCFEEDIAAREVAQKQLGITFDYQDYDEILKDDTVEAVAIGDYFAKRGKMIIAALQQDKHVICDKPICTDLGELEEIERISAEKGLQVCCMLDLRYLAQVDTVKKILESGELGIIRNISFTGQHCIDYENRPKWYFEEGKHGGTINDIAIHGIDLVRFITGKNLTNINYAKTWNAFADKTPDFKDCGQFIVGLDSITLMADVSYAAPKYVFSMPTYWDFYIWCSKGMLNFKLNENYIHIFTDKEEKIQCTNDGIEYLRDFRKEVEGKSTIMNTKDILESQKQTLLIQQFADMA